jgi:hypothetical protein
VRIRLHLAIYSLLHKGISAKRLPGVHCAELFGIQEAESFRIADAHRGDGKHFVVHADEKLTAFVELEAAISGRTADSMKNATSALLARRAQRR